LVPPPGAGVLVKAGMPMLDSAPASNGRRAQPAAAGARARRRSSLFAIALSMVCFSHRRNSAGPCIRAACSGGNSWRGSVASAFMRPAEAPTTIHCSPTSTSRMRSRGRG
jgi:hypothetical protein